MFNIGRVVVKLAGRDAGSYSVIVEELKAPYVVIDGQSRRRKCNVLHLEPLDKTVEIKEKASHEDVIEALKEIGIDVDIKKRK